MFAGRHEELFELDRILAQAAGGNPQHFLLTGERGIGKSSLLLFTKVVASGKLDADDPRAHNFVVVELELGPTLTYRQLIRQLATGLRKKLAPFEKLKDALRSFVDVAKRIEAAGVKYNESSGLEDFELLDELVLAFVEASEVIAKQASGILVLIDEADKAPQEAHLGAFLKTFTDRLTKEGCDSVCVGLAGVTGILQKLRTSHESAPRVFTVLSLKPLELRERKEAVTQGLAFGNKKNPQPIEITDDALDAIAVLSEGFPHFIQQFAYCAFEADDDGSISSADVYAGAVSENGALDQLGEKYFQNLYFERINSNEYRSVLQTMAQSGDPRWLGYQGPGPTDHRVEGDYIDECALHAEGSGDHRS
jgi:type II secretory pathway predicted ATPase ExeA